MQLGNYSTAEIMNKNPTMSIILKLVFRIKKANMALQIGSTVTNKLALILPKISTPLPYMQKGTNVPNTAINKNITLEFILIVTFCAYALVTINKTTPPTINAHPIVSSSPIFL